MNEGSPRGGHEDDAASRAEFLARAHHDLKTPLAVLRGWLETIERSWDRLGEEESQEAIRAMAGALGDLTERIDALLDELRAEALRSGDQLGGD
ncbi:MAG: histidine kinase dimerization/phospho-acceptor domain-containing protein [Nitriliruptorales bacterium]